MFEKIHMYVWSGVSDFDAMRTAASTQLDLL